MSENTKIEWRDSTFNPWIGSTLKALVQLPRDPLACWEWQGARNTQGVAQKQMGDQTIPARRWMWMQLFGPIPTGMVVTPAAARHASTHITCAAAFKPRHAAPAPT